MKTPRWTDPQAGYTLLLTAGVLAILSAAAYIVLRAETDARSSVRAAQAEIAHAVASRTIESRLVFTMLTHPWGNRSILIGAEPGTPESAMTGVPARNGSGDAIRLLALDGRPYATTAQTVRAGETGRFLVLLQDEAGLLNLNAMDEVATAGLLESIGVGAPRARALSATLADFVDGDDLVRAGGAERDAYLAAGIAPPTDAPLEDRREALFALGWRDSLSPQQQGRFLALSSASNASIGLNVNTAPREVLTAVLGDASRAQSLEAFRRRAVVEDVGSLTGVADAGERAAGVGLATRPAGSVRVTIGSRGTRPRWSDAVVTMGGEGAERPFYVRRRFRAPAPVVEPKEFDVVEQYEPLP